MFAHLILAAVILGQGSGPNPDSIGGSSVAQPETLPIPPVPRSEVGPASNFCLCVACRRQLALAPRLIRRRAIGVSPLEPATIQLVNRHMEPILISVTDLRRPARPVELRVAARRSQSLQIDRDGGTIIEEVYLMYDSLGNVTERVLQRPQPARSLYEVVVSTERVASVYFDRTTNQTNIPDEERRARMPVGSFRLPAGNLLQDGIQLDLVREATSRRFVDRAGHSY